MTFVQNAPNLGPYTQRVDESLKHDEPLVWPVPMPSQCRKGKGMSGVVGEIETTLQRERIFSRISETPSTRGE